MILTRLIERECIYSSRDPVIVAVKNLFEEQQVSSSYVGNIKFHQHSSTLNNQLSS